MQDLIPTEEPSNAESHDADIIRPEMRSGAVAFRGDGVAPVRLRDVRKALVTLHTLETMAANVYRFQTSREPSELNRQLIAAMCNEMTHVQDFEVKLREFGWLPSKLRWGYWLVGIFLGWTSRLRGEAAILETGIWVETKAVSHYDELLHSVEWDEETRKIVEKNQADERGHIARWRALLKPLRATEV